MSSIVDRLCELCGISQGYHDIAGVWRPTSEATKRRLLEAMGIACASDEEGWRSVTELETRSWRARLPPVVVVRADQPRLSIGLSVKAHEQDEPLAWELSPAHADSTSEQDGLHGKVTPRELPLQEQRTIDGEQWLRFELTLPRPPSIGYRTLALRRPSDGDNCMAECLVITGPRRCYRPDALAEGARLWGLAAQLYAVRSRRNWGLGDFTDLLRLIEFAAGNGAHFVGVNPLHRPAGAHPSNASPYNPSSRRFFNPLYIDVEAIPELDTCAAARRKINSNVFQARLRTLRAEELVDYEKVAEAKNEVLELLYAEFRKRHLAPETERGRAFREFQASGGSALEQFALFEALQEHLVARDAGMWGWPVWPEPYRDPRSPETAAFRASHAERVEYFQYLQWNASLQLGAVNRRAEELDMPIGLYVDLPLAPGPGGADTWSDRDVHARGAYVGAPPDDFNPKGQDWGLPPWIPAALREARYRPYIEVLRENMRRSGALRIDHVMALLRAYWIPAGCPASEGAYVYYAFDEMAAILALESALHRCTVIGEDLGTVPDEVRNGLMEIGAYGSRVLLFEKDARGAFRPPREYEPQALASISTHDLPTLAGYWLGVDLVRRTELDLFPNEALREEQIIGRAEDRARLLMALEAEELLPESHAEAQPVPTMTPELTRAVHRFVARSRAALLAVQLEDMLGEVEQANFPGTIGEYPNWRRKLHLELEAWPEEATILALLASVAEERLASETRHPVRGEPGRRRRAVIPRATYRLQLHAGFRFEQATALIPYLDALGVSHCYCSPYLRARPGSTHGYDIIDHGALNPEIGEERDYERFCDALAQRGMGHVLDLVPNHMAVMGRDNAWWLDVLENGQASVFADYFDIDWQPLKDELRGKVLLPILDDHYGNVLDRGELELAFDPETGSFSVEYFHHRCPIDPREYPAVLGPDVEKLRSRCEPDDPHLVLFESLLTAFGNLPPRWATDEESIAARRRDGALHKRHLAELAEEAPDIRVYIAQCLETFNGSESYPADLVRLHALLEVQAYRLAYWRVASDEINYRRFFDINELASLRMEEPRVFEDTHRRVLGFIAEERICGLRIDHPDGLYDPGGYFRRLQESVAAARGEAFEPGGELPLYVVAEKILADEEELPEHWAIHGTTGYDFMNLVSRLLIAPQGMEALDGTYRRFTGDQAPYTETLYRSKRLIMQTALASELNVLAEQLDKMAETDPHTRDFGLGGLRTALLETVACFPVYRTYFVAGEMSAADAAIVDRAVAAAKRRSEAADTSSYDFLREVLSLRAAAGKSSAFRERLERFVKQLQQYTGPVAAKGTEDTAFYRYNRLISLNEVGGAPDRPCVSIQEFHAANRRRAARWPHAMLATSTHDSKRSEDVRARLHVLSELPAEWEARVFRWAETNAPLKTNIEGRWMPDESTEYLLYQTLLGCWPLEPLDEQGLANLKERVRTYMLKAAREAKVHTSWINRDPEYEAALGGFVDKVLDPGTNAAFLEDFVPFQERVARLGLHNSLSQTLLKLACPGVPDLYQGNELWRFDLVDPDNRRAVDFEARRRALETLSETLKTRDARTVAADLMLPERLHDGRIKLYLVWKTLALRREHPAVFERGDYVPLPAAGRRAEHVCAFARSAEGVTIVAAALRWFAGLLEERGPRLCIDDTWLEVPDGGPGWTDVLSGTSPTVVKRDGKCVLDCTELFGPLPVCLLITERASL